jgi:FtsP/CotA-like multicopper oxidase with cupredoxin domain
MSAGNRIAIIAVGLVAVILAFVALRPADEEEPASTATTAATTAAAATAATTNAATTTATAKTPADPATSTVVVKGGQPVGGVKEIEIERGDDVRIRVTADAPEEVHVHGYDLEKPVGPGQPAVFTITDANLEGIFEIELHGTATPIASLRVDPR